MLAGNLRKKRSYPTDAKRKFNFFLLTHFDATTFITARDKVPKLESFRRQRGGKTGQQREHSASGLRPWLKKCLLKYPSQSRTQSSQASWSAGGRRERLWGNGIDAAGVLRLTVLSYVTVNSQ